MKLRSTIPRKLDSKIQNCKTVTHLLNLESRYFIQSFSVVSKFIWIIKYHCWWKWVGGTLPQILNISIIKKILKAKQVLIPRTEIYLTKGERKRFCFKLEWESFFWADSWQNSQALPVFALMDSLVRYQLMRPTGEPLLDFCIHSPETTDSVGSDWD